MKFFGSGLFDWLVFAIVFIFTFVGFAIFLTTGDITLVATSVFFGAYSVVAVSRSGKIIGPVVSQANLLSM